MSVIVTDNGFQKDTWEAEGGLFIDLEKFGQDVTERDPKKTAIDLPNDVSSASLKGLFGSASMFRIAFPSFADGRGFSLARQLRHMGYKGKLRARGHLIADQYGFARDCGFDEVEISFELAGRQPEDQWLARIPNPELSYRNVLMGQRPLRNM